MRTRAILTAAASTAATLGGVLASAGTAAVTTAPPTAPAHPTAFQAGPTPGALAVENALEFADGWCVAPLQFAGPLAADPLPTTSHACGHHRAGGGVRVLSDLCIAPITIEDLPGSGSAPSAPCRDDGAAAPGFGVLRNVSVAGVQATF